MHITKPELLLDEVKCRENIYQMVARCKKHQLTFRPHFKTHQSIEIGNWFKEYGVTKIAVSSVSMAEYFSEDWQDILVAFPTNILEIATINKLANKIRLSLLVESLETVALLSDKLQYPVQIFIEIDAGYHRTGIDHLDHKTIDQVIAQIISSQNMSFAGFLTHSGNTYNCQGEEQVLEVHQVNKNRIGLLKTKYLQRFPELIVSYGDTPGCSLADDFEGIDELRPGNFVCYDITQVHIGSCKYRDISTVMACPIISIHEERDEIIIYGGAIHFSKDSLETSEYGVIYGLVASHKEEGWGDPIPGAFVYSLSQEHGKIKFYNKDKLKYNVGDVLYIYPVHSCLAISSIRSFIHLNGNKIGVYPGL